LTEIPSFTTRHSVQHTHPHIPYLTHTLIHTHTHYLPLIYTHHKHLSFWFLSFSALSLFCLKNLSFFFHIFSHPYPSRSSAKRQNRQFPWKFSVLSQIWVPHPPPNTHCSTQEPNFRENTNFLNLRSKQKLCGVRIWNLWDRKKRRKKIKYLTTSCLKCAKAVHSKLHLTLLFFRLQNEIYV